MIDPILLPGGITLRQLSADDGAALAEAYIRNRAHLAPWEPERTEEFFSTAAQESEITGQLESATLGGMLPLVIDDDGTIIGRFSLTGIVRGPFESANLGYWVDALSTGRGLASAAVAAVLDLARDDLGLHRVQAATLRHNAASRRVLERNRFVHIGMAPTYLKIAGRWQDHELFQRILHD